MSDEPRNLPEDFYARGDGSTPPQPAPDPMSPYPQPSYPQNPYQQAPYQQGTPQYPPTHAPYGQQPGGFAGGYGGPTVPNHPSATTSMVLGIVALAGIFFCGGITLVLSPFAWVMGRNAVRAIDAEPGRYAGRDHARGGQIMGIIGTVLLILGIIALTLVVVAFMAWVPTADVSPYEPSPSPGFGSNSF